MWTCRKCHARWNGNKLRCTCGRARPKPRPSHRDVLAEMPYELWAERFGEVCNICGAEPGTRRLHRDHDHATGTARGVLCFRCNAALRHYMTAGWLRAAAAYLERAQGEDELMALATDPDAMDREFIGWDDAPGK